MHSERPRFIAPATVLVALATTVPGVFQGSTGLDGGAWVANLLLGVLLVLVSTLGVGWAERREGLRALGLMLGLYGVLVVLSLLLTSDRSFLVAMPYVSMLVLFLPMRVALPGMFAVAGVMTIGGVRLVGSDGLFAIFIQCVSSIGFVAVFSLIARRERYARADIERLHLQVAELATARERNRIARELHDSLGHCLTIASAQLEAVKATQGTPGAEERFARAQQVIRDGLSELRSVVSILREPPARSLEKGLEALVLENNGAGLSVRLDLQGPARELDAEIAFALYRAAQEALTNVRRHARATKVEVSLAFTPQRVRLTVTDDGVGQGGSEGHGLTGLRERIVEIGGKLIASGAPERGFSVQVEVPTA